MIRILAALIALSAPLAAQQLDQVEQRLVAAVDAGVPDALRLIERTVNINSGTMNFRGVREVGRVLAPEFEALGFTTRWVPGDAVNRAGHLIAERSGRGPHLLLIGHLDTVFEEGSPFQRFERLDDSTARGPGVTDMKGGNAVILLALRALRAAGVLDSLRFTVVLTGDEEAPGRPLDVTRAELIAAGRAVDAALGFEDGDGDPRTAVVARRSSGSWTLTVRGRPAHSSQIFGEEYGSGAIFEAARILSQFHDQLSGDSLLTFNPGVIVGGTTTTMNAAESRGTAFGRTNVIAETAVVRGDLRAISVDQLERAKQSMREIVAAHLPRTSAEIEFDDAYPPMAPTEGNLRLLAMWDQASRDLGFGPVMAVNPRRAGAADISFVAPWVPMSLDGLGLMGTGGHTVEETADLRTLPMQAKRAAVVMWRLARR